MLLVVPNRREHGIVHQLGEWLAREIHEVETDSGVTTVEGVVLLGKPRLIQVDGIYCELALSGFLIFMKNQDVPGVIGHVGTVLGRNKINIANFSLGRRDAPAAPGEPLEAVALVSTDELVRESVLAQLRDNPAVKFARQPTDPDAPSCPCLTQRLRVSAVIFLPTHLTRRIQ